jgi:hypothetical protein
LIPITALPLVGLFYCPLITVLLTKSNTPPNKKPTPTAKEKQQDADGRLFSELCRERFRAILALNEAVVCAYRGDICPRDIEETIVFISKSIAKLSEPVDDQRKLIIERYGCECSDCMDESSED